MRRLVPALAALALLSPAAASAAPIEVGHIPECLEAVPAAIAAPSREVIDLRVLVLLDGVTASEGATAVAKVQSSYSPMSIRLVPTYRAVALSGDDSDKLLEQMKALTGGKRPSGVDLVFALTAKNIAGGGDDSVAGQADCIGGVAFPDQGFAIGERSTDKPANLGPLTAFGELTAKVFSHELGHLLGAHHHYANCAEGVFSEPSEVSPCTVMFPDVGFASLNFDSPNAAVIRGHVEAYVIPSAPAPAPAKGSGGGTSGGSTGGSPSGGGSSPSTSGGEQSSGTSTPSATDRRACTRARIKARAATARLRSAQKAASRAKTRAQKRRARSLVNTRTAAARRANTAARGACS